LICIKQLREQNINSTDRFLKKLNTSAYKIAVSIDYEEKKQTRKL